MEQDVGHYKIWRCRLTHYLNKKNNPYLKTANHSLNSFFGGVGSFSCIINAVAGETSCRCKDTSIDLK